MKIALTTTGQSLDAPFESRFGRAPRFIVVDLEQDSYTVVDNQQSLEAAQGAGIQAAQTVARLGVEALVSGHCGPKAFRVLQAAGITVFTCAAATVAEALQQYRAGKLVPAQNADVQGHWS
jgi:predicted Fe-Mo cluster-binding NifX family protein